VLGPNTQNLQDTFQELKDALYKEGFLVDDEMIVEECKTKKEHHPPSTKEVLEEHVHE
jgi:Holliday junction resolvase RusA-like endonuclease